MWRQLINELMPQHDLSACPGGLLNKVRIAENGCVLFVSFVRIPLIARAEIRCEQSLASDRAEGVKGQGKDLRSIDCSTALFSPGDLRAGAPQRCCAVGRFALLIQS
jgi:hypothetical protein